MCINWGCILCTTSSTFREIHFPVRRIIPSSYDVKIVNKNIIKVLLIFMLIYIFYRRAEILIQFNHELNNPLKQSRAISFTRHKKSLINNVIKRSSLKKTLLKFSNWTLPINFNFSKYHRYGWDHTKDSARLTIATWRRSSKACFTSDDKFNW